MMMMMMMMTCSGDVATFPVGSTAATFSGDVATLPVGSVSAKFSGAALIPKNVATYKIGYIFWYGFIGYIFWRGYISGCNKTGQVGVDLAMYRNIRKALISWRPINERMLEARFENRHGQFTITVSYALLRNAVSSCSITN